MTTPLSSFSGLVSGIDTRTLVDQIVAAESRPLQLAQQQINAVTQRRQAFTQFRSLVGALRDAAATVAEGRGFDQVTVGSSVVIGSRNTILATATAGVAQPGTYQVAVSRLARVQKLQTTGVADPNTALGAASAGTFTINGRSVTVEATDTLRTLRDKLNAANTGTDRSRVSAALLTVGPGDVRLVLTSEQTGATGATLAQTAGTPLRGLGLFDTNDALRSQAMLQAGENASFTIDGQPFSRAGNTIGDAIEGVTLVLTGEDAGSTVQLRLERDTATPRGDIQRFVDAYNNLAAFIRQQDTVTNGRRPPLSDDGAVGAFARRLPQFVLGALRGAAPETDALADIGITVDREGKLSVEAARLTTALAERRDATRRLFGATASATGAGLSVSSTGAAVQSGAFAVAITRAASAGAVTSSGFGGTYDAGATPDTLRIEDNANRRTIDVALATGMTTADIAQAINSAAGAAGLRIDATDVGGELRLAHRDLGAQSGVVAELVAGAGDGAAELFATRAISLGWDVAGTIGGQAATGRGDVLVVNDGGGRTLAGLSIRYTGTATGSIGTVDLALGAGARVQRGLDLDLDPDAGTIATRDGQLERRLEALEERVDTLEDRLQRRRTALLRQFAELETGLARLRRQTAGVTSLLQVRANQQGNS
ncbi:MAG: flagellar filament capping protein FliD [Gemmatimonadales bacterium]|nr:flagellar filament capping protein FliD [Gemmatimonadales bacterium]